MNFISALEELIEIVDKNWNELTFPYNGLCVNKEWNYTPGTFNYYEISYFLEGNTVLYMNNRKYIAKKDHLYFSDTSFLSASKGSNFKLYYITLATQNVEIHLRLKKCFEYLAECLQLTNSYSLEEHFSGFCSETLMEKSYNNILTRHHLLNILIRFHRLISSFQYSCNNRNSFSSRNEKVVANIISYLNENYFENIELKLLSERCQLNSRSLNIIFKNITGYTIIKYLIRIRVEKAKRILGFTSMGITYIALETGFCDCQYFCKVFKALEGMTPMEYRNQKTH